MTGPTTERMLAHDQRMLGYIEQYGWGIQGVFGDDPAKGFHYTVGLHRKGLPELWIATLGPEQAKKILNDVAAWLVKAGEVPADDAVVDVGWTIGFRLRGPVDFEEAQAFTARRLSGDGSTPLVMQVLWPDAAGRYPDRVEAAYDSGHFPQRVLTLDVES